MTNLHQNETRGREAIAGRDSAGRPLSTADLAAAAQRESQHDSEREADREAAARAEERERQIGDNDATGTFETINPQRRGTPSTPSGEANTSEAEQARRAESTRRAEAAGRPDLMGRGNPPGRGDPTGRADAAARAETTGRGEAADEHESEALEPLFTPDRAESYRNRWISIQSGFVDDPRQAVRSGDELVAQVMANLASTFADERHRMEAQLDETGEGATENLRVALRRYRSFFDRLLSL
jgi:hypothetical protein